MPRKRTNTLSDAMLAQTREANRRVLAAGNAPGSGRPFGDSDAGALWFVPEGQADDGSNVSRWTYTGKLYATPNGTTPISATAVKGRNVYEARNTSSVRAGLSVNPSSSTCGDVIGIEPARPQVPYRVVGRQFVGGVMVCLFSHPNDPKIKRS